MQGYYNIGRNTTISLSKLLTIYSESTIGRADSDSIKGCEKGLT